MSNNYAEYRITIFPSQEERDIWVTHCHIAHSAMSRHIRDCEGFSTIGSRCLKIWHVGNINTACASSLLKINKRLADMHSDLPGLGTHHVEGNEYSFDIWVSGMLLSFNDFPLMMAGDSECLKLHCYESWAKDMQKVFEPVTQPIAINNDEEIFFENKDTLRTDFISVVRKFDTARALVSNAKSDMQVISLYEILLDVMQEVAKIYARYASFSETSMSEILTDNADNVKEGAFSSKVSLDDAFDLLADK